ncbi:MAG: Two-component system sensor histidine kinase [uncultured Quadrisphaera sp.]|uniref:histidine kinase n=1 Tax=uncultured Quadrisphaera sp. TaxID=904978 RepID=A0A6J4P1Q8_9ACTN|nr:MAG: Two-component system sensor histidine kinase [uncultured Quadrisphaera sp.]
MTHDGPRAAPWRRHPVLVDAVAVTLVLLLDLLVAPRATGEPAPRGGDLVLVVLALALVPLRHRWPVPALVLTVLAAGVALLLRGIETVAVLAPLAALYTVALRGDRRTTVLAWAATSGVLALTGTTGTAQDGVWQRALPVLPWTAVVAAVGDGLRNRRAYLAAVEERAVRAERTREEEARRRVAEERVRIARELHDVVAHHIAVVSVQAGVAQHLLEAQPAAASEALAHVRSSAAAVLEELGDILSVLRQPGEGGEGAASAPAPGLGRLDALVASFTAAGLEVGWSLHGQPRALAPTVDLVAYRVLEEGLTNALKHGTGTAHLSVEHRASTVVLRVVNRVPVLVGVGPGDGGSRAPGTGSGHGLLGMVERAAAVGGTVRAAPAPDGSFVVEAELPARQAAVT